MVVSALFAATASCAKLAEKDHKLSDSPICGRSATNPAD